MSIKAAVPEARMLTVRWTDGSITDYPFQFLRDNCTSGFHPETQERQFDLLSVPETLAPTRVSVEGDAVLVDWQEEPPHRSRFAASWLAGHRPGRRAPDPAEIPARTWGAELAGAVPSADARSLLADDAGLLSWLRVTKEVGLAVVTNLEGGEEAGLSVGERIGFLRRTNFGVTFRVETKPDPNNLAFTSHALPLHTDLPNQEMPPGFQFLHCIVNDAEGGESVFADGFRIAEIVRERDPDGFGLLTRIPIPYRFHDRDTDIRVHRPMIGLDERGRPFDIRYSAHLMDAFDMEGASMVDYYKAYRVFMAETRNPANIVRFKLRSGEMAVFDNRRVLHGRSAFNPSTGHRLLHGYYVDRGEFDSRIRVLTARP
jgi:gamma-butyrobetaine dioxygenase